MPTARMARRKLIREASRTDDHLRWAGGACMQGWLAQTPAAWGLRFPAGKGGSFPLRARRLPETEAGSAESCAVAHYSAALFLGCSPQFCLKPGRQLLLQECQIRSAAELQNNSALPASCLG